MSDIRVIVAVALVVLAVGWFGYREIQTLQTANTQLTERLGNITAALTEVRDYTKRVGDTTLRMEAEDARRTEQLRGFERQLGRIAADSAKNRALLRTVIPDDMLRGLRSFNATIRPDNPAPRPASAPDSVRDTGVR